MQFITTTRYNMVQSAVYVEPLPVSYMAIIDEEVAYYFNGEHTAEEVCDILTRRLAIAVNE